MVIMLYTVKKAGNLVQKAGGLLSAWLGNFAARMHWCKQGAGARTVDRLPGGAGPAGFGEGDSEPLLVALKSIAETLRAANDDAEAGLRKLREFDPRPQNGQTQQASRELLKTARDSGSSAGRLSRCGRQLTFEEGPDGKQSESCAGQDGPGGF